MTCEGVWTLDCDSLGTINARRISPTGSFIYRTNNDKELNNTWFREEFAKNKPYANTELCVSKDDFESINWPVWLNPGDNITIRVFASGNYIIEDE